MQLKEAKKNIKLIQSMIKEQKEKSQSLEKQKQDSIKVNRYKHIIPRVVSRAKWKVYQKNLSLIMQQSDFWKVKLIWSV